MTSDFDFILTNIKPIDSPLRFAQDLDNYLIVCPYGKFANTDSTLMNLR